VTEPSSALAGASAALGTAVENALVRRGLAARGAVALERAGMSVRLADLVLVVGGVALAAAVLGWLAGGLLLALAALVLVPLAARLLVSLRAGRRQAAFADQLDDSLQLMASSMRAGHSLLRALDAVAQDADAPTAEEFARIVNETRVGRDLGAALDETAERMGSEDFAWVAQAIGIHREVGGNLAEVLDAVSGTIRERNAIRRQVKALAAEGKLSAIVLLVLPFGIAGFLYMTNPAYLSRFTQSGLGWAMLVAAVVMLLVGALWLKKTVSIRF
jgi:tight adherence protein B